MKIQEDIAKHSSLEERLRKQALRVWITAMILVALWPLSMAAAPIFASNGITDISAYIYTVFSFICHQNPERSYHLLGNPIAVCARCFGVYFGLFLGFIVYVMFIKVDDIEPPSRIWLVLSLIPIGIDWTLGFFGIWENTHLSRFVTGGILGTICTMYLVPAFVEIRRNQTLGKLRRAS